MSEGRQSFARLSEGENRQITGWISKIGNTKKASREKADSFSDDRGPLLISEAVQQSFEHQSSLRLEKPGVRFSGKEVSAPVAVKATARVSVTQSAPAARVSVTQPAPAADHAPFSAVLDSAPKSLEQVALMKSAESRTEEDLDVLEDLLLKVKFNVELSATNRRQVAQELEFRAMRAGKRVFSQGDLGEDFFIILKGCVAVSISDEVGESEKQVATLISGDSFGDLALLQPGAVRRATCVCKEECHFAVLNKKQFDKYMHAENQALLFDKLDFLRTLPIIGDEAEPVLTAIAYVCTPREFQPNSIIIAQGDEIEDMYFVVSGNVKLVKELDKAQGYRKFVKTDFENPYRDATKKAHPKYKHVQSPTMAYIKTEPPTVARARRAAALASGTAKLIRAVAKLSAKKGLAQLALAAAKNKHHMATQGITHGIAHSLQFSTRVEVHDRLFLEVATAGPSEFFGENCLDKVPRSSVSVVAHTTVKVYILNKWDIMKILPKTVWSQLQDATVIGSLDERTLKEQFYRHLRWEKYRLQLVEDVLAECAKEKAVHPAYYWTGCHRMDTSSSITRRLEPWR